MSSASAGSEPVDGATSLAGHAANGFQLRLVAVLCVAYALAVLALHPFASVDLTPLPHIAGIYATAVLVGDISPSCLSARSFASAARAGCSRSAAPTCSAD